MQLAKRAVNLDVPIVSVRLEPDQFIGPYQAAKAPLVRTAGRHVIGFIDDDSRQIAMMIEQMPETLEHLFIREPSIALPDHSLCREEDVRVDNRFESVIGPNPHLWAVFDPRLLQLEGADGYRRCCQCTSRSSKPDERCLGSRVDPDQSRCRAR